MITDYNTRESEIRSSEVRASNNLLIAKEENQIDSTLEVDKSKREKTKI